MLRTDDERNLILGNNCRCNAKHFSERPLNSHNGTMKCGRTTLRLQKRLACLRSPLEGIKMGRMCESLRVVKKAAILQRLSNNLQAPEKNYCGLTNKDGAH